MIESTRAVKSESLAGVIERHRGALLLGERVATKWRVITSEALQKAADAEVVSRRALLDYLPRDPEEALEKAMYISALMIAQARSIDVEELENLISTLGY
ncbi:hypothetical protein RU07_21935 [Agrobacterium tumefaciens]|uniref:Uncharacterized protein n=1 Tax=Agrobacterium tumefaciens TaxID=358 RepID=A0A0D0KHH9_AGRTU|nr:hypothetical protein RU07_21935 [Agrobacterium tumefaciens]